MNKIETFWKWFANNGDTLTMLNDQEEAARQTILEQLQQQLDAYCEGLSYEISEPTPQGRTLTFSAEGDTDLFRQVVELVDNAPDFDWWEFVAFKQPQGSSIKVTFDKYVFNTDELYFMQLESAEEPDILGLRIALPNPKDDDEDQLVGVYVTLEAMIGEFDCATLIGYLETVAIPADPIKEGFQPLNDFPEFVEWFKQQRDR